MPGIEGYRGGYEDTSFKRSDDWWPNEETPKGLTTRTYCAMLCGCVVDIRIECRGMLVLCTHCGSYFNLGL